MALLHMTDRFENLQSICAYGVLFTYNPLEAADTLFGSKEQAVASFAPDGMICLTELPYCDTRDLFGSSYGVTAHTQALPA